MAVIDKYAEARNPDKNGIQYQQELAVSGANISDEYILPAFGSHSFGFTTTGSGVIQVSLSPAKDVMDGTATWFDNDLQQGPTLNVNLIGFFKGCTAIRINNVSGNSTLQIITKGA